MIRFDVRHYYELLQELTGREIKARYKQSVLGYTWVILNPFFQMLVMAFVFSQILRFGELGVPYALFLYVGLLPWNLFAGSLNSSVNALVGNAALLTKIYFPREIFILSTIIAKVVDFLLALTVLALFFFYYREGITLTALWVIPIFLIQLIFTYGLSVLIAAFNLFYRDIQYVLGLVMILWMYLTPVIYPVEIFPDKYRIIFQLNPMAVLINAYREVLLAHGNPNLVSLGIALGLSVTTAVIGHLVFKRLEGTFADIV